MSKKLAIFFPGVGYHKDKPLLYYSRKIAESHGYELMDVEYHDLPVNIKGDAQKMKEAAMIAYQQCEDALRDVDFSAYDEVVLVGKSIGTYLAATYANEHLYAMSEANGYLPRVRLVLYTPVEATFQPPIMDGIAFIGENDSWSDLQQVEELAGKRNVSLWTYPGADHSMETGDRIKDIENVKDIMELTDAFLK